MNNEKSIISDQDFALWCESPVTIEIKQMIEDLIQDHKEQLETLLERHGDLQRDQTLYTYHHGYMAALKSVLFIEYADMEKGIDHA